MFEKSKQIDLYISKSADFAKPILTHLRELMHEVCPDVEEKIKWSFPHFDYLGEMMCSMAAFKQHCAFSFWKASLMKDATLHENAKLEQSMGHLGKITSMQDLPSNKKLKAWIKEAMQLNEKGIKVQKEQKTLKKELIIPQEFITALNKNKEAKTCFEKFGYSHKKEYVEWIADAKTIETKNKRIITALEWLNEGKSKNWKYEKKKNAK